MINTAESRIYRFRPDRLDPVTVFVEQYSPSCSRVTVQCYARAWTAYWGSHGEQPVEQFMLQNHAEYIAQNLTWGLNGRVLKSCEKHDFAYLMRIVEAIQAHFALTNRGDGRILPEIEIRNAAEAIRARGEVTQEGGAA